MERRFLGQRKSWKKVSRMWSEEKNMEDQKMRQGGENQDQMKNRQKAEEYDSNQPHTEFQHQTGLQEIELAGTKSTKMHRENNR